MNVSELTAETILDDSVFEEIFSELDPVIRDKMIEKLINQAMVLRVKIKFDNRLKAFKAKNEMQKKEEKKKQEIAIFEQRQQRQLQRQYATTQFNHPEQMELFCGDWICDMNGVRAMGIYGEIIACYNPILPIKRLVNIEDGKEKMLIAFYKNGRWKEIIIDKSDLLTSSKIGGALLNSGVLTSSENTKYLVKYFLEIEAFNSGDNGIPTQSSTSKMGWLDNYKSFMPFTNSDIVFDSESGFQEAYASISEKGNRNKYITLLKQIRQRDRIEPMLCIAVSLSSVLVKPCGVLPFIFHLYGEGGKGKTLATILATSIWGNPNEEAGLLADPKSTPVGFEVFLNFLNNLPFICDDMSKIKKNLAGYKVDFSEFIYFLCGMTGKRRSNTKLGNNKIMSWRNCSITNAEKPITSEVSNGGELLRCFELEAKEGVIFDDGSKGKNTADFIRANYGFLGKEFISVIQKIGVEEIKKIHNDFMQKLNEMDTQKEKEGKQINPVALWMTADKILTDYIIQDGVYLDIKTCFDLIKSNKQMSDNERAYEFILNEYYMHKKKFSMNPEYEPEQRWGYLLDGFILINPNAFNGFCERGNFSRKMFVEWAVKNGLSQVDNEKGINRTTKKVNNTASGIKGNFIFVKLEKPEKQVELANFIDYSAGDIDDDLPF